MHRPVGLEFRNNFMGSVSQDAVSSLFLVFSSSLVSFWGLLARNFPLSQLYHVWGQVAGGDEGWGVTGATDLVPPLKATTPLNREKSCPPSESWRCLQQVSIASPTTAALVSQDYLGAMT